MIKPTQISRLTKGVPLHLGKELVAIAGEIKRRLKTATEDILEIGKQLTEAKKILGHGKFLPWIEAEFAMSERTARNFMEVFEKFKSATVADLENVGSKALYLLAAPSTPESARREAKERAAKGEKITHEKAKEIRDKHRPKPQPSPTPEPTPEPEDDPAHVDDMGPFNPRPTITDPEQRWRITEYEDDAIGRCQEKFRHDLAVMMNRFMNETGMDKHSVVRFIEDLQIDFTRLLSYSE